jgi:osmotically-inducible protein OsmY
MSDGAYPDQVMKKPLLMLLLGAVLGTLAWRFYERKFNPSLAQRTREVAGETKEQAAASARVVGSHLGDAGIVALLKGKYLMDKELSALAIGIECRQGRITLTGSAESPALVARATRIARETKGVTAVNSKLTVRN